MKDLLKSISKVVKFGSHEPSVAIEIGERYIKLAKIYPSKGYPKVSLVKRDLSSKDPKYVSGELKNMFDALDIKPRGVSINIPRHLAIARIVELPSTSDEELKEMVRMELIKQMPYADEEMLSGYRIIEKRPDGYSSVLLAMAQSNVVNGVIDIARQANLSIERIAMGSEALFEWYSFVRAGSIDEGSITALINIDAEYTDIDIMEKGRLAFTRAVSFIAGGTDSQGSLSEELKKTIMAYKKSKNADVEKIVITGARNQADGISIVLREELGVPIETIDQAKGIRLVEGAAMDMANTSFAELVGLSIKADDIKINLLPETMRKAKDMNILKRNLKVTAFLSTGVIIISLLLTAKMLETKSTYLSIIDSEIKKMRPRVEKAKRMKEDINIIEDILNKKPLAIDVLNEIYKITPQGIAFNMLDYESDRTLILRGNAPTLDETVKFISVLENSLYFDNAKIKYTTKRMLGNKQVIDFEIVCDVAKL